MDTHPGHELYTSESLDSVTAKAFPNDVPVEQFLSRPIEILNTAWNVNGSITAGLNPWRSVMRNILNEKKINNYRLIRGKLKVKVLINGTPFHYGRLLLSYYPLIADDEYDWLTLSDSIPENVILASQRPSLWIDPTNSQGGEMCLPFFWPADGVDLTSQSEIASIGEMKFWTVNTLRHALGKTTPCRVTVYAWMEDVKLAIPTQFDVGTFAPNADEYAKGSISQPASTIAKVAKMASNVPGIAPFAKATEIGANGVAAMAKLFGYSRPPMLEGSRYRPQVKLDMATTSGLDDACKLSTDPKQETTLDTRVVGLSGEDELTISSIAERDSYLTTFSWTSADNNEQLLWNCVVDPCLFAQNNITDNTRLFMPACCVATLPFAYWKGTMKFRFQVISSKYHKGRIAVAWDPVGVVNGSSFDTNSNYLTMVDISDTTDFTVEVGWGQTTAYREHCPLKKENAVGVADTFYGTTPLNYTSTGNRFGNGALVVRVINELVHPDEAAGDTIEVNVFISAGDDFEVAAPTAEYITHLTTNSVTTPFSPQSEPDRPVEELSKFDGDPKAAEEVDRLGPQKDDDKTNLVYFGEKITSFRQLLKRYNQHEFIPLNISSTTSEFVLRAGRQSLPFEPCWINDPTFETIAVPLSVGSYLFSFMTLMRYLSLSFLGFRGSIRYTVDSSYAFVESQSKKVTGSWYQAPWINYNSRSNTVNSNTPQQLGFLYGPHRGNEGQNGMAMTSREVNPVVSYEIPYFSRFKFGITRRTPKLQQTSEAGSNYIPNEEKGMTYHEIISYGLGRGDPTGQLQTYVAAGEDFNLLYYQGPPIFYFINAYPSEPT